MLTIFSTPKPFRGYIEVIQTNAIRSWVLLRPKCEVILFGDEQGTAEVASELGIRHVTEVERNEYGTPLVSSMFKIAQDISSHNLMCYVNADIILMSDFLKAVQQINLSSFLLVGQRWDVNLREPLHFDDPVWETKLHTYVNETGKLHGSSGIDYFVFSRGLYRDIPPFAIGRPGWDNWMIYQARFLKAPVIDATRVITAIHQNHDYSSNTRGEIGVLKRPETMRNRELAGQGEQALTLEHATWTLTSRGLRRALTMRHLYFRLDAAPVLYPYLHLLHRPMKALTRLIIHIRHLFGITEN